MTDRVQPTRGGGLQVVQPDAAPGSNRRKSRRWLRDGVAVLAGITLFVLIVAAGCAITAAWDDAFCSGEWRPFLRSGRQAFAVYGCLARDAGPMIGVKKALGIYDPAWKTVIK